MSRWLPAMLVGAALSAVGSCSRPSPSPEGACPAASEPNVVCTSQGAVQGVVDRSTIAFKGIPYAAPPVGELRWHPPQPGFRWTEVRDASQFGPVCPQREGGGVVGDEDCLTLNVWTPPTRTGEALPVMVYLTGGGNHGQSGQGNGNAAFGGVRLVPEGVVLVTFNIRLGALGFLTHPVLDAERADRVSGNYGNLDQMAVLRWLQANIAAFGGDPDQVFLFATSAGGANICGLMTSPLAAGLFHGAAMESSVPTGCEYQTLEQAQARTGVPLAEALGCDTADCLRTKSPEELVLALEAITSLFPRTYGPVVDGYVFPDQPIERIRSGEVARIPVIIGNTAEEAIGWLGRGVDVTDAASYPVAVERLFGGAVRDRILAEYVLSAYPSPRAAFVRAATDAFFTCRTRNVARALVEAGAGPVYRYLFTHPLENDPMSGVGHSREHSFFFEWRDYEAGDADERMSAQLVKHWTQMAKTGRPASETAWPGVTSENVPYIELAARG